MYAVEQKGNVAGNFEANLDNFGLSLDFSTRLQHHSLPPQHIEPTRHSCPWPIQSQPLASSNALPSTISGGVAHFLGIA